MKKIIAKFKNMDEHKLHHWGIRALVALVVLMFVYRFVAYAFEQHKSIFNLTRDAAQNGVPVSVIKMKNTDGVIYEPLFINNNRGYVSGMRVARFRAGQKITGGGEIVSVSNSLDLDSGMHVVRTRGASNGAHTVEIRGNGFYVPTYAIQNSKIFVAYDGAAHVLPIKVIRGDSDNTMISGIPEGTVVITSHVTDGALVKVIK